MKIKYYFIATIVYACLISSCEQNHPIGGREPSDLFLTVVKFSSSQYPNYVVTEKDYSGDYEHMCYLRSSPSYMYMDLVVGSSPYIALPNDYYVVDWKWGQLIYPPTNFLIDVDWSEVKNRHQRWEYASLYITSQFLTVWETVSYEGIDRYLQIEATNKNDYVRPDLVSHNYFEAFGEIPDSLWNDYMTVIKNQDSLQNVYIERLSRIIEEGNLPQVIH